MRCIRQWAAFDRAVVVKQVDTNAVGDVRVIQAALPLDHESENPVVVNTSSGLGSFWAVTNPERHESHKSFVVYRAAKAAVSMLTVRRARLHLDRPHRQRCGSYGEGAEVIVRLATIGKDGSTGTFQRMRAHSPYDCKHSSPARPPARPPSCSSRTDTSPAYPQPTDPALRPRQERRGVHRRTTTPENFAPRGDRDARPADQHKGERSIRPDERLTVG